MKKKYFSKNLITEGLSQIKIPSIICFVVTFLGSVFIPVSCFMSLIQAKKSGYTTGLTSPITFTQLAVFIIPFMYIAPAVLSLILFSFLNKRSSSDFYHSLSSRRITVFISFAVSVIIWICAIIIIPICVESLLFHIFGFYLNASYVPWLIGTAISGALLIMACTLLAMSATGTIFTNIILTGFILFLPRLIIYLFTATLTSKVNVLVIKSGSIVNYAVNIPVKFVMYLFGISRGNINTNTLFSSGSAIAYTLVIAALYFVIAAVIFVKRKSETAGSGAPNKILQHIYRCTVSLPFALAIPVIMISSSENNVLYIIILSVITLFVYYLYELLTTKSFKKMIKATPVLVVVAGIAIIFGLSINIAKERVLNVTPSASDIKSVSFEMTGTNNDSYDYSTLAANNIKYSNQEMKDLISSALKGDVEKIKSGENYSYTESSPINIVLNSGKSILRKLDLSQSDFNTLQNLMIKNHDYAVLRYSLPSEKTISGIYSGNVIGKDENLKLWESFQSEFYGLSDAEKDSIISVSNKYETSENSSDSGNVGSITAIGTLNMYNYHSNYLITGLTPKTEKMYVKYVNSANHSKFEKMLNLYDEKSDKTITYMQVNAYTPSKNNSSVAVQSSDLDLENRQMTDTTVDKLFDIISRNNHDNIDLSKPFISINFSYEDSGLNLVYFEQVTNSDIQQIKTLK